VSPVRFPAYYAPDEYFSPVSHILFGNDPGKTYMNPYAELVKGYKQESKTTMLAQFELKQDFGQWVEGLSARFLGNTIRNSGFDMNRAYSPYYYSIATYDKFTDEYTLMELNPTNSTGEALVYTEGGKSITSSFYGEGALSYNRTFAQKHAISGMMVAIVRNTLDANAKTLAASLPARNLGLSGRFTYAFDNRYFSEFNFGYNGSEKFDKGHRWGFFPSYGLGWMVSNEAFYPEKMRDIVSKLKVRGTYGLVGNDEIGSSRFFYLSDVTLNGGLGYTWGYNGNYQQGGGPRINNYANPLIGWEIAYKTNLGFELGLFGDKVEIIADLYKEHRVNILQTRADIPIEAGLWSIPQANVGKANGKGMDVSIDYNHSFTKDLWLVGRGNFTYAHSTYQYYEEPDYVGAGYPWLTRNGQAISQPFGYVAERLFIDQAEIDNSPRQDFSAYMPGDIKYKDINGDNIINEIDKVPIGRPTTPEINYGFGLSAGYKKFDISVFFQGSDRYSFFIDPSKMSPFFVSGTNENALAQFIADDRWTQESQNPMAAWPRLNFINEANNMQTSTWWMRDGGFLRLKSAEIGYSIPDALAQKLKLSSCRFYVSGTNLLLLYSKFNIWDIEMGGSGLNYPLQRVVNLGLNLTF
jgi:TonB-linked SusC/RagA family outer membrane protein